jgi:hypothetical protein
MDLARIKIITFPCHINNRYSYSSKFTEKHHRPDLLGFPIFSNTNGQTDGGMDLSFLHKVHNTHYRVRQCMSPRRNRDSPIPLSRQRVCLPTCTKGGARSPAGEGLGESQFRRLEKKLSTLPTLWFSLWPR